MRIGIMHHVPNGVRPEVPPAGGAQKGRGHQTHSGASNGSSTVSLYHQFVTSDTDYIQNIISDKR